MKHTVSMIWPNQAATELKLRDDGIIEVHNFSPAGEPVSVQLMTVEDGVTEYKEAHLYFNGLLDDLVTKYKKGGKS